jgi:uncharacterized protein (UPF0262 family)
MRKDTKKAARTGARQSNPNTHTIRLSRKRLDELVEQATVDCYNEEEQLTGLFTMIEENLLLPFETSVLGVKVTVARIDLTETNEIVAVCARGRDRQAIPLLHVPLPSPRPEGFEWIMAYRWWTRSLR